MLVQTFKLRVTVVVRGAAFVDPVEEEAFYALASSPILYIRYSVPGSTLYIGQAPDWHRVISGFFSASKARKKGLPVAPYKFEITPDFLLHFVDVYPLNIYHSTPPFTVESQRQALEQYILFKCGKARFRYNQSTPGDCYDPKIVSLGDEIIMDLEKRKTL